MATAQSAAPVRYGSYNTFDSAVSVLEVLPEEGRKKVLDFSVELLKEEGDNPFRPKPERELMEIIDHSLAQANDGKLQDADEALDEVLAELKL